MTNIKVNGHRVKVAVTNSGMTREKVVVMVQELIKEEGLSFSLAGLMKLFEGEAPKKSGKRILTALASVLSCQASDFAEFEAQTA